MHYLFSKSGLRTLDHYCAADSLLAFDFDGTLAPIADHPDRAQMTRQTAILLEKLRDHYKLAVISGRSRGDVIRKLPFRPDYIVGNHGLEGLRSRGFQVKARGAVKKWVAVYKRELPIPGIFIEGKRFSLAVHFRGCPDRVRARRQIFGLAKVLRPKPRIIPGKSLLNLIPEGAPHKGAAVLELMQRSGKRSTIFVGDDDNDEDVFRLNEPCILKVRVGMKRSSAATFYLKRQSEVNRLLARAWRRRRSLC